VIELFEAAMRGDVPAAFASLNAQFEAGADPAVVLADLAGFCHVVTRLKLVPDAAAKDPALTETERRRGAEFAQKLSMSTLSRAWQILLKAVPEVEAASRPLAAAEMVLVRLAYAADLPSPEEALRFLKEGRAPSAGIDARPTQPVSAGPSGRGGPALAHSDPSPRQAPPAPAPSGPRLHRFEDAVALAGERREIGLKTALERDVHLVRFEEGRIEFALAEGASRTLANDLARALDLWTGRRWVVALSSEPGAPTLKQQRDAAARDRKEGVASHPLVQAVLSTFPGAEIVDVREKAAEAIPDPGAIDPDPTDAEPTDEF
jgi:DNA polymerase-3 subunit gamma/tau